MGVCQGGDLTAEGGERRFGSRGWVPRIEYGAGSVCTGTTSGSRGWVPVCTGTTSGSRGWVPRIEYGAGSVCTGTTVGRRGWVPVCTGTTVVGGWYLYAAPTGGRTRGSAPTAGHARIPLIAFLTRTAPGRAGFKPAPTGGDLGDWSDLGEREGLSESGFVGLGDWQDWEGSCETFQTRPAHAREGLSSRRWRSAACRLRPRLICPPGRRGAICGARGGLW